MATAVQQDLAAQNEKYASTFSEGHLALPPAKKYAVVTCMDARKSFYTTLCRRVLKLAGIDPVAAFGITLGDAHVIRNAGGNAKDALRSLVISQQLLRTNEVLIIKHTGCGMLTFKNEDAYAVVEKNLGSEATKELAGLDFQPFSDLRQAVEDDVKLLKRSNAVPDNIAITGWVYDVETGKVEQIV
ncbi:hypothetical protein MMC26_000622 [Xylographa opegraphella]|nr:hypothetical protein [Xylographa opegraphella]